MPEPKQSVLPKALRKEGDDYLVIDWEDGKTCKYLWKELREKCPCAGCKEERETPPDPFRILSPSEMQPLKPVSITPVGYYAYKITWSDGHDAGLFTLEFLRQLCGCDS